MLYYLFDITVTVENEEAQTSYKGNYLANYPNGTEQENIEADAAHLMDRFADTCSEDFCREFAAQDVDVQTDLDAYVLTEEEYNRYKKNNEGGE
jgi:hypothetical protein